MGWGFADVVQSSGDTKPRNVQPPLLLQGYDNSTRSEPGRYGGPVIMARVLFRPSLSRRLFARGLF